jgi:hypothetical protein
MGWAGGLYLLATGLLFLKSIPLAGFRTDAMPGRIFSVAGSVLAGGGVALVLIHGDLVWGVLAALGLGLAGAVELYCGVQYRGGHVLARDWLISGIVGLGTAAALPFFISLGARRWRHHFRSPVDPVRADPPARCQASQPEAVN